MMKKTKFIIVLFFAIFSLITCPTVYAQGPDVPPPADDNQGPDPPPPPPPDDNEGPDPPPAAPINMALPCLTLLGIGLAYKVVKKSTN